jgi:hypothetical protein
VAIENGRDDGAQVRYRLRLAVASKLRTDQVGDAAADRCCDPDPAFDRLSHGGALDHPAGTHADYRTAKYYIRIVLRCVSNGGSSRRHVVDRQERATGPRDRRPMTISP